MPGPALTPLAKELCDKLAPLFYDDALHGYALAYFIAALATTLDEVDGYVRIGPNDEESWSGIVDLNRVPTKALPWLAQFVGVTVVPQQPGESLAAYDARTRVRIEQTDGWKRGTPNAMRAAAADFLTGSKTVVFRERYPDAYSMSVVTYLTETPSSAAVLAALLTQKPAGIILNYSVLGGQDYQSLFTNHANYSNVFTSYATYEGLVRDVPGT